MEQADDGSWPTGARVGLALLLAMALAIAGGFWWLATYKPGLSACEDAIKATLKAPATYQRVSADGVFVEGSGSYTITYDAENSFGVPLRGSGICSIGESGHPTWLDTSGTDPVEPGR